MARRVRDQVRANMPETYAVLTAKYDGDENLDIVGMKVKDALVELFPAVDDPDEEVLGLTDFQARFAGDYATHLLIPTAMDYYGLRTGRSDSFASLPDGQDARSIRSAGPGTGRQQYDRLQMLKDLDAMLIARMTRNADRFYGSGSKAAGVMVSPGELITVDPLTMPSIDPRLSPVSLARRIAPRSWFDYIPSWPNADATNY